MHRLIVKKLGPIEGCELNCSQFMTLTGFQASGKSTIAKAIYYFRTIKDDIVEIITKQAFHASNILLLEDEFDTDDSAGLKKGLEDYLRQKFLSIFGSLGSMDDEMYMEYQYTQTCCIKISLKSDNGKYRAANDIVITFSRELKNFLQEKNNYFSVTPLGIPEGEQNMLKKELYQIFDDHDSVIYIPAGRSMITLLSQQLSYIYVQMSEIQKRSLDRCTRDYLEHILRIREEFSDGLLGLAANSLKTVSLNVIDQAFKLIKMILRGTYQYSNGTEKIVLENGKHVKLNYASSGQQECVWILNLLFYYLLQQKQMLFIIEEPESHLFPESQKYMTEFIALVNNCGHSVVLTTHSPYVLGTLNNLLYADAVPGRYSKKVSEVIPKLLWIYFEKFHSWFVKNGVIEDCMDSEIHMIQNERIDEISKVINQDFDRILELQDADEKEGMSENAIDWF